MKWFEGDKIPLEFFCRFRSNNFCLFFQSSILIPETLVEAMLSTVFISLLLMSDNEMYNPVLKDLDEDFHYKAPLLGELSDQFVKCPLTRSDVITMKKLPNGDHIAIRSPVGTNEISL